MIRYAALADGVPAVKPETDTGAGPQRTCNFVYGTHNRALAVGQALVSLVGLSCGRRLLVL